MNRMGRKRKKKRELDNKMIIGIVVILILLFILAMVYQESREMGEEGLGELATLMGDAGEGPVRTPVVHYSFDSKTIGSYSKVKNEIPSLPWMVHESGTPSFIQGERGSALGLDEGDKVKVLHNPGLKDLLSNDKFALSFWIKDMESLTIQKRTSNSGFRLNSDQDGNLKFNTIGEKNYPPVICSIDSSDWKHVIITAESGGSKSMYINGVKCAESQEAGIFNSNPTNNVRIVGNFLGIDDIKMWNRDFSPENALAAFQGNDLSGIVVKYSFGELEGDFGPKDVVRNEIAKLPELLKESGTLSFVEGHLGTTGLNLKVGDGGQDKFKTKHSDGLKKLMASNEVTVSFRVKGLKDLSIQKRTGDDGFVIFGNANRIRFKVGKKPAVICDISPVVDSDIRDEEIHVAVTARRNGDAIVYINGVECARGDAGPANLNAKNNFRGRGEVEYIDEMKVHGVVLSDEEIRREAEGELVRMNRKRMDLYGDREFFLISDKNWEDVLALVPLTTWTQQEGDDSECKRGYGTPDDVCVHPTLIYHEEEKNNFYINLQGYRFPNYLVPNVVRDGALRVKHSLSKYSNLQPGEIISYNVNIKGEAVVEKIFFYRNSLPDFLEFYDPIGGVIDDIDMNFPEGETFEFKLKVQDNANPIEIGSFDADSIIYFIQQYDPNKVTIIGETPQELDNLLVAEPELGAGISSEQIQRINLEDYFSYWEIFEDVVYVENDDDSIDNDDVEDYEKGLLASTYASLINAPLVIEGNELADLNLIGKNIICIGDPIGVSCDEQYDLEQLKQRYVQMTNTNKIILVNPNDLNDIKVEELFQPEKSSDFIFDIYSKTSLASPLLASAKHELILSITSTNYEQVDAFIEESIDNLDLSAEYLTILASPDSIPMTKQMENAAEAYENEGHPLYGDFIELDNRIYGDLDGDYYQELAVGRIIGITFSDISSYIARDLFYNSIPNSNDFAVLWKPNFFQQFSEGKSIQLLLSEQGFNDESVYLRNLDGPERFNTKSDLENKFYINYLDHGYVRGGSGGYTTNDLIREKVWLSPSIVINDACSVCAYDSISVKQELFCTNLIRRGALIQIGAVENAGINWDPSMNYLQELMGGKSSGKAFRDYRNKVRVERVFSVDPYYILLGDPHFNFNLNYPSTIDKSEVSIENIDNYNKVIHINFPRVENNLEINFPFVSSQNMVGTIPPALIGNHILRSGFGVIDMINEDGSLYRTLVYSNIRLSLEIDNPNNLRVKNMNKVKMITGENIFESDFHIPSEYFIPLYRIKYAANKIFIYLNLDFNEDPDNPLIYKEMSHIPEVKYEIEMELEES